MSILLHRCTIRALTKRMEKRLNGNYTRMLRAILNKLYRQHTTKPQLYGQLPSIPKHIQVTRTKYVEHCWRSKEELKSDILLLTPSHGRAKVGRPARTDIEQLCADTGRRLEDLPRAMDDGDRWRLRVREISASGVI